VIAAALVASRLFHYGAVTVLFGAALFPLYAYREPDGEAAALTRHRVRRMAWAAGAALLSGLLWLAFSTASMTGDAADAVSPAAIWTVVSETPFGRIWAARMGLTLVILGAVLAGDGRLRGPAAALAGGLLASIALTGHAQAEAGSARIVHMLADGLHLIAGGAWLGALVAIGALVRWAARAGVNERLVLAKAIRRFSRIGYGAVAALVGSGLVNAIFLVGSLKGLVGSGYGRLLLVKLGLFAAMLVFAAVNRVWISPALDGPHDIASAPLWLIRLRRNVIAEQALGTLVLAVVAVMGTLAPPAGGS
jgi:putative copper resistance protein D